MSVGRAVDSQLFRDGEEMVPLHNGFKQMTNNRQPMKLPGNVQGLRFRIQPSQVMGDAFPPFMTMTNHGYLGYLVLMDRKFFESLPPDVCEAVREAMADATQWKAALEPVYRRTEERLCTETMRTLEKGGVIRGEIALLTGCSQGIHMLSSEMALLKLQLKPQP